MEAPPLAPPACCHLGGVAPSLPALPTGGLTPARTALGPPRTDSNIIVLDLGWGAFIGAGIIAMHFLGHALWLNEEDRAAADTSKATASEGTGRPEAGA
ncbi:hypothetical protein ABZU45_36830 [Streptomyces avermitilis]|uniref:hypothetical protein n=1 Tax=Streptomyces avermitilis TaxID=33903 RepID=UPI0033AA168F